jgi:glycine cleavage system H lipoate-binding protein
LKLAPLLAQYLYQYRRLDLPGLGTFILDSSVVFEPESNKKNTSFKLNGVVFENNSTIKDSPALVDFIALQTGKIKALAAADLYSLLEEAQQFLNIGKPFLFEGIGSLTKIKSGEFAFAAGQALPITKIDYSAQEIYSDSPPEESSSDYKEIFYQRKRKSNLQKPVAIIFLVAGLFLAIWGGYIVYKKTTTKNKKKSTWVKDEPVLIKKDTLALQKDSLTSQIPATVIPPGNYKFIIEIAGRERALNRFAKLKNYGLDVQLETRDSVTFKLFFLRPALIADTARMIDSLRKIYTPPGSKAFIEN